MVAIQRVTFDRAARFCRKVSKILHRLAGRYCSYLLPKQVLGTHEEKGNAIWRTIGCDTLYVVASGVVVRHVPYL